MAVTVARSGEHALRDGTRRAVAVSGGGGVLDDGQVG